MSDVGGRGVSKESKYVSVGDGVSRERSSEKRKKETVPGGLYTPLKTTPAQIYALLEAYRKEYENLRRKSEKVEPDIVLTRFFENLIADIVVREWVYDPAFRVPTRHPFEASDVDYRLDPGRPEPTYSDSDLRVLTPATQDVGEALVIDTPEELVDAVGRVYSDHAASRNRYVAAAEAVDRLDLLALYLKDDTGDLAEAVSAARDFFVNEMDSVAAKAYNSKGTEVSPDHSEKVGGILEKYFPKDAFADGKMPLAVYVSDGIPAGFNGFYFRHTHELVVRDDAGGTKVTPGQFEEFVVHEAVHARRAAVLGRRKSDRLIGEKGIDYEELLTELETMLRLGRYDSYDVRKFYEKTAYVPEERENFKKFMDAVAADYLDLCEAAGAKPGVPFTDTAKITAALSKTAEKSRLYKLKVLKRGVGSTKVYAWSSAPFGAAVTAYSTGGDTVTAFLEGRPTKSDVVAAAAYLDASDGETGDELFVVDGKTVVGGEVVGDVSPPPRRKSTERPKTPSE